MSVITNAIWRAEAGDPQGSSSCPLSAARGTRLASTLRSCLARSLARLRARPYFLYLRAQRLERQAIAGAP